jgi:AAA+ superfamily predicted ATPase
MTATDPPILLVGPNGEPYGKLRSGTLAIVAEAEARAARDNLAKSSAIVATLKAHVENAGYGVNEVALADAVRLLNQVRRGDAIRTISVTVNGSCSVAEPRHRQPVYTNPSANRSIPKMIDSPTTSAGISFFEAERTFPNADAQVWYESLEGLDDHKQKILLELELLLYPDRLADWSKRHHQGTVLKLCERSRNRVPLILFEGDIGTGKTALAETVGDALARRVHARQVHLLKINTQVRGTGQVGEMSDLIVQAFTQAEARARSLKGDPVLLLLDEADALAASRDMQQMHHEDKAGLNTILQRLDSLRPTRLPIAALFITNRPDALDPAIRRRAALTLRFERPNDKVRAAIFRSALPELNLSETTLVTLVRLTGGDEKRNCGVPFTASDLTDRLLPAALRAAYAENRALTAEDLLAQAKILAATPPFGGNST